MEDKVSVKFRRNTYILVIVTVLLMLLGGYVKAIGAGLACPDWPLCYGELLPFIRFETVSGFPFILIKIVDVHAYPPYMIFAEWFHRLVAVLSGMYMMFILYHSISYRNHEEFSVIYRYSKLGLLFFVTQGLWGALTVTEKLSPLIVVAHLGNAVIIILVEMIIAFYATIYSGGYVKAK